MIPRLPRLTSTRSTLVSLSLSALSALSVLAAGCAAPSSDAGDDSAGGAEAAISIHDPISLRNWSSHPAIVDVRKAVSEVDKGIARRTITRTRQADLCHAGVGDDAREKDVDASGVVRKLVLSAGGEDSYETTTYYFDGQGKPRFVFQTQNTVWGMQREIRVYLRDGAVIWEVDRSVTPANPDAPPPDIATAPFTAPAAADKLSLDAAVLAGPAKAFDAKPVCE